MSTDEERALGEQALSAVVSQTDHRSGGTGAANVEEGIHSHGHDKRHAWLEKLVPGVEKLTVKFHAGNFVAIRDKSKPPGSERFFESMPIYARIGMHLLFYGKEQRKLLEEGRLEKLFREETEKEGRIYDSPESVHSIPSFIQTYKINLDELLIQDLSGYHNFNEFFYRKLKPGARPVEIPDPQGFCCLADSRLTVYQTVQDAQKFWIKGDEFTVQRLLYGDSPPPPDDPFASGASLAIFRLAPADYHRYHSPLDGTIARPPVDIPGTFYTVNPQAVNEIDFDVFTANKRSVLHVTHSLSDKPVAIVAIGALLVGSIVWTKQLGETFAKGDELGYFAYGGSTVVAIFPQGLIQFDEDLVANSKNSLETYVKVGYSLGTVQS